MSVLDRLDSFLLQGALQIARTLRDHGHQALFAGGIARDLLLGHPVTDVDIAVSATPDEIEGLFEHTVAVESVLAS